MPEGAPANTYGIKVLDYLPGDVNGDNGVNIFDLLDLLKQIGGASEKNDLGDVDGDGDVNIFDLLELLKLIAGKS